MLHFLKFISWNIFLLYTGANVRSRNLQGTQHVVFFIWSILPYPKAPLRGMIYFQDLLGDGKGVTERKPQIVYQQIYIKHLWGCLRIRTQCEPIDAVVLVYHLGKGRVAEIVTSILVCYFMQDWPPSILSQTSKSGLNAVTLAKKLRPDWKVCSWQC